MGLRENVGKNLRGNAETRQDQDVDLRVSEDPEEMLPEHRVAALGHFVEVRPKHAVEFQEDQSGRNRWKGKDDKEGRNEGHPDEYGHAHERHTRRPQVDDRDDEVKGRGYRRDTKHQQTEPPKVDAQTGGILLGR